MKLTDQGNGVKQLQTKGSNKILLCIGKNLSVSVY